MNNQQRPCEEQFPQNLTSSLRQAWTSAPSPFIQPDDKITFLENVAVELQNTTQLAGCVVRLGNPNNGEVLFCSDGRIYQAGRCQSNCFRRPLQASTRIQGCFSYVGGETLAPTTAANPEQNLVCGTVNDQGSVRGCPIRSPPSVQSNPPTSPEVGPPAEPAVVSDNSATSKSNSGLVIALATIFPLIAVGSLIALFVIRRRRRSATSGKDPEANSGSHKTGFLSGLSRLIPSSWSIPVAKSALAKRSSTNINGKDELPDLTFSIHRVIPYDYSFQRTDFNYNAPRAFRFSSPNADYTDQSLSDDYKKLTDMLNHFATQLLTSQNSSDYATLAPFYRITKSQPDPLIAFRAQSAAILETLSSLLFNQYFTAITAPSMKTTYIDFLASIMSKSDFDIPDIFKIMSDMLNGSSQNLAMHKTAFFTCIHDHILVLEREFFKYLENVEMSVNDKDDSESSIKNKFRRLIHLATSRFFRMKAYEPRILFYFPKEGHPFDPKFCCATDDGEEEKFSKSKAQVWFCRSPGLFDMNNDKLFAQADVWVKKVDSGSKTDSETGKILLDDSDTMIDIEDVVVYGVYDGKASENAEDQSNDQVPPLSLPSTAEIKKKPEKLTPLVPINDLIAERETRKAVLTKSLPEPPVKSLPQTPEPVIRFSPSIRAESPAPSMSAPAAALSLPSPTAGLAISNLPSPRSPKSPKFERPLSPGIHPPRHTPSLRSVASKSSLQNVHSNHSSNPCSASPRIEEYSPDIHLKETIGKSEEDDLYDKEMERGEGYEEY